MRPEPLTAELGGHGLIVRDMAGERLVTTAEVLAEERRMIAFTRDGRGRCRPLAVEASTFDSSRLSDEQRAVVRHVLTSPDRVMLVRGVAGTGKTTLLTECVNAVRRSGVDVVILAPSADASRGVLRAEGFSDADTVARFLVDAKFQERAWGNLIWVDEAGLLGSRDVARLCRVADDLGARVVLAGDRHQHHSVARGSVTGGLSVWRVEGCADRAQPDILVCVEALVAGHYLMDRLKCKPAGEVRKRNPKTDESR